eukprot:CAMPEP_0113538472 /NCGR_PEP_ID=MMETSP0015_2-20120614/7380_1 /TAXON_ID=2838 /ORGANISM="Odontella" /LENGTH=193 /DNA_ID=CAMNT_0000438041 /DNA_START=736 /DNA_END=1314 /DNA_ORIENTATION=+ /assembly_acc=CAM_ASM_000160
MLGGIIAQVQDYVGSGILHFGPNLGIALFGGDVPQKFQDIRVDEPDWNGRMSTATTRDPTWDSPGSNLSLPAGSGAQDYGNLSIFQEMKLPVDFGSALKAARLRSPYSFATAFVRRERKGHLVLLVRITVVQHAYVGGIIAQDYVGSGILHFGPNLGLALFGGDVPQKFQDIRVDEPDWNGRMSTATTRDPTW